MKKFRSNPAGCGTDDPHDQLRFRSRSYSGDLGRTLFAQWSTKRREDAQKALAEAKELQKQGEFEAARLRYQHVLGLQADMHGSNDTLTEAILTTTEEIGKRRAQAHPRLNRKLDLVLRNQALDEAIRTVVEAGGFELDRVTGSLADVIELLNLPELRATYLDLRYTTVISGAGLAACAVPSNVANERRETQLQ